jgi:uncharacterized membrane protein required for colicin V production
MSTAANHPTEPEPKPAGMQPWLRFLFSLLFFGSAGYFAYERDFVLAGICLVTGLSAFSGYRMGLVCVLTWVIAIGAAIRLAPSLGQEHELHFQEWLGTTGLLNRFVSIGVVGVLISFAVSTVLIVVTGRLLKKRQKLDDLNRWLGFSIGAIEGLLVCLFFLGGMLVIEPIEQQRAPYREPNGPGTLVSRVIPSFAFRN